MYSNGGAPQSSLTNTQIEVRDLFTSGEVAMMIDHPGVSDRQDQNARYRGEYELSS